IERWDGAGLRFSENVYLATGNSQPFSMTESPGVGLESTGDVFRRHATALNPVVPDILTPADFRDMYRHARRRSDGAIRVCLENDQLQTLPLPSSQTRLAFATGPSWW